jgi:hypothetical protein
MNKRIITATVVALAAGALSVVGAAPALASDTTVVVTVNAGALSISTPVSSNLGSGQSGDTISGALGTVTVTDDRALLSAEWTATVSSTDFTTGGGTPAETIGNSNVKYWSGAATATTGTGTFTPGQATSGDEVGLGSSRTAFTETAGVGNNSASWNPTIDVDTPAAAVAGTYTGTVTHSVA